MPKSSSIAGLLTVQLVVLDQSVAHPDRPVGAGGDGGVVSDEDKRVSLLPVELHQEVHDLLGGLRVQRTGRLVGPHYGGVVHERTGDRHPLLLAAAHLVRALVGLLWYPHRLQGRKRLTASFLRRRSGNQEEQLDVLDRRQDRDQVVGLENEAHPLGPKACTLPVGHPGDGLAPDQDLALLELIKAGEAVEERRLPAPGGSHDGDHLAAGYREIHPSQGVDSYPACRVLLLDPAGLYHGPVGGLLSRHLLTCVPDQNSLLPSILAVRRTSGW